MDPGQWTIKPHIIPASYVRGYRRGVRDEKKGRLKLAVKQYTPNKSLEADRNAATIIFVHGVGSTKECYEPFFARLLEAGLPIRNIWTFDIAWHGESYLMNEEIIGDEPHWDDVSRDILQLVNYFQEEMPQPLIGIGQSWGGYPLFQAALWHPRLFMALVGNEPFVSIDGENGRNLKFSGITASAMARRRDVWPSLAEARKSLLKSPYFQAFDPEVFELVMSHDFRELPKPPGAKETPVTLKTPKAMEVVTMMRLEPGLGAYNEDTEIEFGKEDEGGILPGFYRIEPTIMQHRLPHIRPAILYCFGTNSTVPKKELWLQELFKITGTGKGGNGGAAAGMVDSVWIEGAGHPMPFEKPKLTADKTVPFLKKHLNLWEEREKRFEAEKGEMWTKRINPLWMEKLPKL